MNMLAQPQPVGRRITQAPQILVFQLRIFDWADGPFTISDRVEYGERLELGEWAEDGQRLSYQLVGVVPHSGESVDADRCVTATRRRVAEGFHVISDSIVDRRGDFAKMTGPEFDRIAFDPCLWVYSRLR